MVEPNVTTMVIKVDLQCHKCYKKIKKVLCKFPQIRDQVYDEKKNTVTIKVVGSCPEKIKQKICCKGGECVIGIDIIVPKPPPPPPDKSTQTDKPRDQTPKKPELAPCYPPVLVPVAAFPIGACCTVCFKGRGDGQCHCRCGFPPPPPPPEKTKKKVPAAEACCTECSEGRSGGPCYRGCGYPPPRCYEGYYGRPVYDSWGGGYRGGYYVCEENPSACSIM